VALVTAPVTATAAAAYYLLDSAYRAAIARTSKDVLRVLGVWWTSLDPSDLAGSSQQWLTASTAAILVGQTRAVELADAYAYQVRRVSVPGAEPFTPPPRRPPNAEQVRKSLIFNGIVETAKDLYALQESTAEEEDVDSAQRTVKGRQEQLMKDGLARAGGSAIRLVTLAGRDQLEDVVRADKVAVGWARTTKPGCCYFCAVLASRGYVYKEDSFELSNAMFEGVGSQKVHDNCGCGLRPIYGDDPLPERTKELSDMWVESQRSGKGKDPLNKFRQVYEASPLSQASE
jgi:hypothetical protein